MLEHFPDEASAKLTLSWLLSNNLMYLLKNNAVNTGTDKISCLPSYDPVLPILNQATNCRTFPIESSLLMFTVLIVYPFLTTL